MTRAAHVSPASRLLTAQEAADYFRLPLKAFERLNVGRVPLGAAIRYDRLALDAHLDTLSGLSRTPAQAHDNDDAEAALDRFTPRPASASGRSPRPQGQQ
jgi:hypothetical protein